MSFITAAAMVKSYILIDYIDEEALKTLQIIQIVRVSRDGSWRVGIWGYVDMYNSVYYS
jgi:hypothetical protein